MENEYKKFSQVFSPEINTVILNSGGGAVREGLKIGEALRNQKVSIIVNGVCTSACANYLFLSGASRNMEKGIVGFHGSATACSRGKKIEEMLAKLREDQRSAHVSEAVIDSYISWVLKETKSVSKTEITFFKSLGVSEELFDRSCTADKGMNDGRSYDFLLPTSKTMKRYGIENVIGEQNTTIQQALTYPTVID